ncbi:MAG: diadenylate cyclase CdaA [Bacteroidota bacterium]
MLQHLLFIKFTWLDAVDILLVSILLYQLYRLVRGTVAINIFIGVVAIVILWQVVSALQMQLLSRILGSFISVGVIALIIVFQQELRRFLIFIGTSGILSGNFNKRRLFSLRMRKSESTDLMALIKACRNMSESKTGAIIVIATKTDLNFYASTGEQVDAKVTSRMLESIFFKNNPLHDGAVIISGNRIVSARCVLPVTEDPDFPSHLGMRHRAAAGITEASDALAIVVSEQTGEIAFAKEGRLKYSITLEELRERLEKEIS